MAAILALCSPISKAIDYQISQNLQEVRYGFKIVCDKCLGISATTEAPVTFQSNIVISTPNPRASRFYDSKL